VAKAWLVVSLKKLVQHIGIHQIRAPIIPVVLQPFRVAAVTTMVHSSSLATTAPGGVRQRAIAITPGSGTCTTSTAMSTVATTMRVAAIQFVVLGINLFGKRNHLR